MYFIYIQVKTEGGLNASASFVAKANPLNRIPHKRKSELHHALCNMLSSILAPLADGGKSHWPPTGVDPALMLWYEAIARIRSLLMHWMEKQSKHIAVSGIDFSKLGDGSHMHLLVLLDFTSVLLKFLHVLVCLLSHRGQKIITHAVVCLNFP